jgi:CHAT domain-containing protein
MRTLLAGLSLPGPVVAELPGWMAYPLLSSGPQEVRNLALRDLPATGAELITRDLLRDPRVQEHLQDTLALPGVKQEIAALAERLPGTRLEDGQLSLAALKQELRKPYRIVHIATHGIFSGDPENSFLLTHDHLLNMNALGGLFQSEAFDREPVELLTLSACQTAEGDERSPLGLTGVAIQSGARSALGSLWPVADTATQRMLTSFYGHLGQPGVTKAKALQQAQLERMADPEHRHPFFWSAFILVGNWM